MSDCYAEILEQIAQVKPVTVKTVIQGREGLIAEGAGDIGKRDERKNRHREGADQVDHDVDADVGRLGS